MNSFNWYVILPRGLSRVIQKVGPSFIARSLGLLYFLVFLKV